MMGTTEQGLLDKASALIKAAKEAGADASDVVAIRTRSSSIKVRLGKIEASESGESCDFSLRVFIGSRMASISANLASKPDIFASRVLEMAKASPRNLYEGLADDSLLIRTPQDLDLFDSYEATTQKMIEDALTTEAAALAVLGVTNSGGASICQSIYSFVLVTSRGFCGHYMSSHFGRSCSAIAGKGTAMERDYDYSSALHFADMETCESVGKNAGERAVRRLSARQAKTSLVNVVFDPRMARTIANHLAAMLNGASVARKTSLLCGKLDQRIMRPGVRVSDNPLRKRGVASQPFDGEGVEGIPLDIIEDGVLKTWLLSCSAALELGLKTNGRAIRSSSSVPPSCTNFAIEAGNITPEDMIKDIGKGFYVTELFGHGVDLVTGQYSRGASGFWIENGILTYPISEVTLGSNLSHILTHLIPANDLDRRYAISAPTVLIEGMILAGK
ncbi:MAG: antibiotic maturation protein [Candidatus Tokpelaia sp. JSC188]|nr:MAG: antibiotic maturation protein [Candidatus Tokpelaia sp. JSC188]